MDFKTRLASLLVFYPSICLGSEPLNDDQQWIENPNLAALTSFLIPGSVQLSDKRYERGFTHLGISLTGRLAFDHYSAQDSYIEEDKRTNNSENTEYLNLTTFRANLAEQARLTNYFLSSYDAYQSRTQKSRYHPKEKESNLWLAPFNFEYLSRPTTYLPIIAITAFASDKKNVYPIIRNDNTEDSTLYAGRAFMAHATAVGEEAFFRGYVNSELSENYGETRGLIGSTVIFGLTHSGEGNQANLFEATAIGGYLGWLHQRNNYHLGESIAVHYWLNLILAIAEIEHGRTIPAVQFRTIF